jgi:hypothetical protein
VNVGAERHLPGGITLWPGETLVSEGVYLYVVHKRYPNGMEMIEQRPYDDDERKGHDEQTTDQGD